MEDGLVTLVSRRSVKDTLDALAEEAGRIGLVVFSRIDHAANAQAAGAALRPTEVIVFGNVTAEAILLQDEQSVGLDLPLRAIAWEDQNGEVWLTYNDPHWIARRHELAENSGQALRSFATEMATIARYATGN